MPDNTLLESQALANLKGQRLGPYLSHNPVTSTQIWQWCAVMGDNSPNYHPGENQIAPPAMMQMWTMRDYNDEYAPGSTDAPPYQIFEDMASMGYPSNVAVSYDIRFHHSLRVGDRVKHYTTVVDISDKKSTRLGTGFFVTEKVEYLTQDELLFADALITYFQYDPAARPESLSRSPAPEPTEAVSGTTDARVAWYPELGDLDVARLAQGTRLPELRIPITHKLIVAGAIATQDFIPVHHNLSAARAAGMPDIFMNILTTSGLSARFLSDWAGPGSCLRAIKFDLMAPNTPGDVMVMTGEVLDFSNALPDTLVTVVFRGENSLGLHVSGTATLSLPGIDNKG